MYILATGTDGFKGGRSAASRSAANMRLRWGKSSSRSGSFTDLGRMTWSKYNLPSNACATVTPQGSTELDSGERSVGTSILLGMAALPPLHPTAARMYVQATPVAMPFQMQGELAVLAHVRRRSPDRAVHERA